MVEFRMLGTLSLSDSSDGREVRSILAGPKRVAILAYLSLSAPAGLVSRETLRAMFWSEASDARARNALSQFVFVLRRGLGPSVLVNHGNEEIGLAPGALWCDAVAFEGAIREGRHGDALDLYGGDLLPGFHLDDCPAFERWLDNERNRLSKEALQAALHLATSRESTGNVAGALPWYYRARELAPCDERLVCRMLVAMSSLGDASGAIREFDAFERRLENELGLEPSPETRRLVETIRGEGPRPTERPAATPPAEPRLPPGPAPETSSTQGHRRATWRLLASAAGLFSIVVALGAYLDSRQRQPASSPVGLPIVTVTPFTSDTEDGESSQLGVTAARRIAESVSRSGLAEVVSPRLAALPGGQGGGATTGVALHVAGTYSTTPDSVRFGTSVIDTRTASLRRTIRPVAVSRGSLESGLALLAERATAAVGTAVDPRFADWFPSTSLPERVESYQRLSAAVDDFVGGRHEDAVEGFLRVARAEPELSMPRIWAAMSLTRMWYHSGHAADSLRAEAQSIVAALESERDGLPAWDRAMLAYIEGLLAIDFPQAHAAMREVVDVAPSPIWYMELALMCIWLDRPDELLDVLGRFNVNAGWLEQLQRRYWSLALTAHHRVGNYDRELELVRSLQGTPKLARWLGRLEIRSIIALGRDYEVLDEFNLRMAAEEPGGLMQIETELRAHGYVQLADRAVARIVDLLEARPAELRDDDWRMLKARYLMAIDRDQEAEVLLEGIAEDSSRYLDALSELGLLAARRGDREAALGLSAKLDAIPQLSLRMQYQAQVAAALGDRARAVTLLRRSESPARGQLHRELSFPSLLDYPPFRELERPRG